MIAMQITGSTYTRVVRRRWRRFPATVACGLRLITVLIIRRDWQRVRTLACHGISTKESNMEVVRFSVILQILERMVILTRR